MIVCLIVLMAICVGAEDVAYSEGLEFTSNGDGTCSVSGIGSCRDSELKIPPIAPNGETVTSIGDAAFLWCMNLTNVAIPDSVIRIRMDAFSHCHNLNSISIGCNVKYIEGEAFEDCTRLTSISIPNSVTGIGSNAFEGCIEIIQKDNGVYYVDKWVIGCDITMQTVELRPDTIGICDYAFYNCTKLTSIIIEDKVRHIGEDAFWKCTSLNNITIPNSVIGIGADAFLGCTSLSKVVIGSSVTTIGCYAFNKCVNLTSITIPNSLTNIGFGAFQKCDRLNTAYYSKSDDYWNANVGVEGGNQLLVNAMVFNHTHTPDTAADCTRAQVCTVCNAIIADKLGHDYASIFSAATCAKPGFVSHTCTRCAATYIEELPVIAHTAGSSADCTHEQTCSTCGQVLAEKLGHDYSTVIIAPNCSLAGYSTHTCIRCGRSYKDSETPANGHTPGDWTIVIEPTIGTEGKKQQSCTACGEILNEETIPALPEETEPETEPVTEPKTEPVTEPETEPVTEPESEPETNPVTEAPSDDSATTEEPTEEESSTTPTITVGCSGSILSCGLLMLIALAGAALIKRKE